MAKRVKPPILGPKGKSRVLLKKGPGARALQNGPTLNRLTVLWVNGNGVPFDTTGFNAALYRGNTLVQTARFDRYGVVFFSNVPTITTVSYTVQLYNNAGIIYRTRTIPAEVEAFAVIG
ncbi:hypothetical protein [Paenibacillus arenilitoris]|uniref:DUF4183 domain-containing protein n=1 Tax=Paenibacillus arenilitoris TaxID=2772299 RepID=A0A927CRU2_9BACL|nr:hypothetical protein [Paenibacillus arenilitoris]MBD2872984.1 hypothetical protein [Paenibacillus arenilitoris]